MEEAKQMMNEEYGRELGGCVWTFVAIMAALVIGAVLCFVFL